MSRNNSGDMAYKALAADQLLTEEKLKLERRKEYYRRRLKTNFAARDKYTESPALSPRESQDPDSTSLISV